MPAIRTSHPFWLTPLSRAPACSALRVMSTPRLAHVSQGQLTRALCLQVAQQLLQQEGAQEHDDIMRQLDGPGCRGGGDEC